MKNTNIRFLTHQSKDLRDRAYIITDDKEKEREFGNLLKIDDNWKKIVVSLDDFTLKNYKGIKHIGLR